MIPPTLQSMQDPLDIALSRELRRDERLLWQGRQLARISKRSFGLYLFAIPWTVFALLWTMMAAIGVNSMEGEFSWVAWAFPGFGIPFVLVGLGMLSTPFLPLLQKGKIIYAVTDQRIFKVKAGKTVDVKSVPARRLGMVERSEKSDGSGSLKIAIRIGTDSDGDKNVEYFELGEVENVRTAQDHIAAMSKAAARPVSF